jgi:hypothetical protein
MAKITKLEAGRRQIDAAIRMFFENEDVVAVHTISRAGFRVLFDITKQGDEKQALDAHIKKIGAKRFNDVTNFLKHANSDADAEIDEDFQLFTEAGIGFGLGLYHYHNKTMTPEMKAFSMWSKFMRPQFFELPEQLRKDVEEWKAVSKTDPDKIETQANARLFGKAILHWVRLRMSAQRSSDR